MDNTALIHIAFDLLAVIAALLSGWLICHWKFQQALPKTTATLGGGYFVFLGLGSITGAYVFGTLNLYMSDIPEIGRSIVGALLGAICMVEYYKIRHNLSGSTGYIYVVPFTVSVIIGRIGCFFSGLHDQTHGIAINQLHHAPWWGWDYGDHILRHPVQLYESASMIVFLLCIIAALAYCHRVVVRYGFYLCVGFYATQRFIWEFFKPYGAIIPPFNIFHILCLALLAYSIFMITKVRNDNHRT